MSTLDLDVLTQRLDRLERETRRLKQLGAVVLIGIIAMAVMGQTLPGRVAKVVEGERLLLRDSSGRPFAVLGSSEGLAFFGHSGAVRALLSADGLSFADHTGAYVFVLGVAQGDAATTVRILKDGKVMWKAP